MYYVTMRITFVTRKFGNVERNSHCDVLHITPVRVARLVLDCNGVFAIKAYRPCCENVVCDCFNFMMLSLILYCFPFGTDIVIQLLIYQH